MIICDLDGTISDHSHRLHHVMQKPKDYDAYYEEMDKDPVLPAADVVVRKLAALDTLVFLTGRPEKYRIKTAAWLLNNLAIKTYDPRNGTATPHDIPLFMRPNGDFKRAVQFKEEIITRIRDWEELMIFIDDDRRNDEMYLKYGLLLRAPECWQCML